MSGNPRVGRLSNAESLDFELLDLLKRDPNASQRAIAEQLGVSVGRVNYLLRALRDKGVVKLENFATSEYKLGYIYTLTPSGIAHRARLARGFLARKRAEYDRLRAQIAALEQEIDQNDGADGEQ